jgi:DNA-binding NarL/FixJ family response regulator
VAAGPARSWRVVIIDDNVGFTELLSRAFLRDGRFDISAVASNGAEGVKLVAELQPELVILDDEMPVMTGVEALPDILSSSPSSKVVLFSANLQAATTMAAIDLGACAAVSKLDPLRSLFESVERCLGII